jgi:hypothetical protein
MTALADGRADHRGPIRRIDAVLGGPVWWACHLGASYWLIPRACGWGTSWPLHAATLVLLLLIGRAALSGVQLLRAASADTADPDARRDVFLGWVGVSFSLLFGAVVVAEWVPSLFLDPCW